MEGFKSTTSSRALRAGNILWLLGVILLAFGGSQVMAQELGSIVGTITDPSGAALPGVTVTVTNEQTGVVARSTTTNDVGNYECPDLTPSVYSVRAEKTGFQTTVQSKIGVEVRGVVRTDLRMTLGAVTQEVTVTATSVHLQTETGTVSQSITGTNIAQIDTNGRSIIQLATLVPGAASTLPSFNTPVGVTANTGIAFNGAEPDHNVWSIDGVENYDRGCGGCVEIVPDQDAIQEFTVLTSNAGQDVGHGTAGHIQMEIKSGTSQFHGEAFEFVRNTSLDASTFFANASNTPKPTLNFNNFGFNVGGPIYRRGHEKKTFFFFEADWRRLIQGETIHAPAPPADWTTGLFDSGSPVILDHSKPVTLPGGIAGYQPFPNNQVPTASLDPNAVLLGKPNFIFPSPNGAGNFFTGSPAPPTNVNEQIVRIDHQFSDKTSLMGHYLRDGINQDFPTTLWSGDTYPTVGTAFLNEPQSFMLKLTHSISSSLLNEAQISYNRQPLTLLPTGTYQAPEGLTIKPVFPGVNTDNRIPTLNMSGSALGTVYDVASWPWTNVLNTWTARDSISKITGNHSLNFGAEYQWYAKQQELFGTTQGTYTFNGSATNGSYLGANGQVLTTTGNEFADFMLGQTGSTGNYTQLQNQTIPTYINEYFAPWIGDAWKVRPGLTLNFGLRWEIMPHAHEQRNQISVFRPSLFSTSQIPQFNPDGSIVPGTGNLLNGIGIAGQNGIPSDLVDNHWTNFGPRVGFAWQPGALKDTVIRGGYGLLYENIQGNDIYNVAPNPPFSNSPSTFNTTLSNPGGVPGTIFPSGLQAYQPTYPQPYSQQYSLGVQRQFGTNVVGSLSYVGSHASNQNINVNLNQPTGPVTSGPINLARPYLGWANIGWYQNTTYGSYNSLQATLRFANWRGLTAGINYTYSHCLDFVDGDVGGIIDNSYNVAAEYGNCGYDIRQNLIINYTYLLPIFRSDTGVKGKVLGGWTVSGITTFSSGLPLTINAPGDPAECGCSSRADEVGGPNSGSGIHTAAEWFNTAAFAAVPTGQFGNSARNVAYGQGINNWDTSLFKNFAGIPFPGNKEGAAIQFRIEFFNFFNHTQFNGYGTTFGTPGFGAPNSTRDPREIQLAAKFMF
ncbi:MAG TPA: carboxypeptidase-like regulatory domain-containing protein [Terriglobia bacterium]